ncbi:MAG TPA: EAL domain-containing protein [Acetobacteraceae bacterium]
MPVLTDRPGVMPAVPVRFAAPAVFLLLGLPILLAWLSGAWPVLGEPAFGWLNGSWTLAGWAGAAALAAGGAVLAWTITLHLRMAGACRRAAELHRANACFDAALNHMGHGLLMVDAAQRLVLCNRQFLDLYGLRAEVMRPGIGLEQMFAHSIAMGNHPGADLDTLLSERRRCLAGSAPIFLRQTTSRGLAVSVRWMPMEGGFWACTVEDVTERDRSEQRLAHLALHDALTGLPNRHALHEALEQALAHPPGSGEGIAVLTLDLDRFKHVNDMLGHQIGDKLLVETARRLRAIVREGDLVARLSSDEFAVLQTAPRMPDAAETLARRLVEVMGLPYDVDGRPVVLGASVGVALAEPGDKDADAMLAHANLAMQQAKQHGRGTWRFFASAMDDVVQARRSLEMDLRQALENDEFELYFQPLVSVGEQRVSAFEALLRWRHPARGLVPPESFVPLAEEIGLILPIGDWVLRTACTIAAGWPEPVRVAVNLSSAHFLRPGLLELVESALAESGLHASRLELEITESVLLQDSDDTLAVLHGLRARGARISMDDFGTGYSSLSYLRSFPFDKIKIDKSFIKGLPGSGESRAIVSAIIGMGRSLGIATTAEGVETRAQLQHLVADGCTEVQGFYFSPPRPAGDVPRLLGPRLLEQVADRSAA